jgi:hypothetical protein
VAISYLKKTQKIDCFVAIAPRNDSGGTVIASLPQGGVAILLPFVIASPPKEGVAISYFKKNEAKPII